MKRSSNLAYVIVFMLSIAAVVPLAAQNERKVGIFDRAAIVIAYYRSPLWGTVLSSKMAESRHARVTNDTAKMKELDDWAQAQQNLAHQQIEGTAPINNITDALQPAFAEIERTSQVSQVIPAPYVGKAETVDVTNSLLDWLKADESTRQIIREQKQQK